MHFFLYSLLLRIFLKKKVTLQKLLTMDKRNITIKDLPEDERPREKMLAQGRKALSNSELIAIILGSGSMEATAVGLAQRLLNTSNNSLVELSRKGIADLKSEKGIGDAKAVSIMAALELGCRMWAENKRNDENDVIKDSTSIYNIMAEEINTLPHEEFWAIYLNNRNKMIGKKKISTGGLTNTAVDVRLIIKYAVECNATVIAVAHNHPSGKVNPSKEDINLTKKIKEACEVMDIKLLDHIIIGEHFSSGDINYFSFYDNGML